MFYYWSCFYFIRGAVVYKSKTQSITASSSTEAEFIATHAAAKIAWYLRMLLKKLGYEQKDPTPIHIDNLPDLRIINDNSSPIECAYEACWYKIFSASFLFPAKTTSITIARGITTWLKLEWVKDYL